MSAGKQRPIYVTVPNLPPMAEFVPYLEKIWENQWLTNCGPFHQQLEVELAEFLGVGHLSLFNNGTIALITSLQALELKGEVITTPFSFVATAHSLLWNNLRPVFVDIEPTTLNLNPASVESAITPDTSAILPVHCYGGPCDVLRLNSIAERHRLRVVYDAAHAFGVRESGHSLLKYGDYSVLSFHATKVFNTFEGGAVISPSASAKQRIDQLRNFGIADEGIALQPGMNGKMNEVQAAFGLLQLKHIDMAISRRAAVDAFYRERLSGVSGIKVQALSREASSNFSYFPILVGDEYPIDRDELEARLRIKNIQPRRYFYPLISDMPMYQHLPSARAENLPVAKRVAAQVLCLPIYPELSEVDQNKVVDIIVGIAG